MGRILQKIKWFMTEDLVTIWILTLMGIGFILWYIKDSLTFDVDDMGLDKPIRIKEHKMLQKDNQIWELTLQNSNHVNVAPHTLIKTSSIELATALLDSIQQALKDNGYKSFTLSLKSRGGVIITKRDIANATAI